MTPLPQNGPPEELDDELEDDELEDDELDEVEDDVDDELDELEVVAPPSPPAPLDVSEPSVSSDRLHATKRSKVASRGREARRMVTDRRVKGARA